MVLGLHHIEARSNGQWLLQTAVEESQLLPSIEQQFCSELQPVSEKQKKKKGDAANYRP